MTRRDLLKLALSTYGLTASANALGLDSAAGLGSMDLDPLSSLRAAASTRGISFGTAVRGKELATGSRYTAILAEQCGILVPESGLKWDALRPTPEQFDFSEGDQIEQFAAAHGTLFRGVPLVWEQALPKWFAATVNSGNARRILLDHISTVAGHYAGRTHSWDVVNEAIKIEDGRADGLKVTPWLSFLGPEYIELAFHAAHEADPKALLIYNENRLEWEGAAAEQKRQATLTLLTGLVRKGVPIHGLGIQSHLIAETDATGPGFKRFLHAIEDFGLCVLVTEMDVRDYLLPRDIAVRDALVAKQYYNYLSFMLKFRSVKTVLTWGLSDRSTWLAKVSPRQDGMPVRPLLYDSELRPKPAFAAVGQAMNEAPER